MKYSKILFLLVPVFFGGLTLSAQSTSTLKTQIALCARENKAMEVQVNKYKEVMKQQHTEAIENKLKINKLKKQIAQLNTKNDKLNQVCKENDAAAKRMLKLADKFDSEKSKKEAITLYNLLITSYPNSVEASEARTILRNK